VGEVLYEQKGIDAIRYCTAEFRNSCSHAVVISILLDHGESSLPDIAKVCKEAPGGKNAYNMCFHGLGHGVLAYHDYDLKPAIEMCRVVGTKEGQNREFVECVGGAIMEMRSGNHDPDAWKEQYNNYFRNDDPRYPCDASWFPEEARPICYIYLTPNFFTATGGRISNPTDDGVTKAFSVCAAIEKDDVASRAACYGGFGKEFVVQAQGLDIRNVGAMPTEKLERVRQWCALAGDKTGEQECYSQALISLFWAGENVPDASFSFCGLLTGEHQSRCYSQLAGMIRYYSTNASAKNLLCTRIPSDFRSQCTRK
jgi:hypothetical protein